MAIENAVISKADVRFYPELCANQIELTLQSGRGESLFRIPMDSDSMYEILNTFGKDSVMALQGVYCRAVIDDATCAVRGIRDIVYDSFGEIEDNPIA